MSLLSRRRMQDQKVTASLRQALSGLPGTLNAEAKARLRERVDAYVDETRALGWPIERVIVALKQIAAEAGLRSSTDVLRVKGGLEARDALLLDVVRWCVERYFEYERPRRSSDGDGAKSGKSRKSHPDVT